MEKNVDSNHASLRTVFDCDANEWHNTTLEKKIQLLGKLLESGHDLDYWLTDYVAHYKKLKRSDVISSIPKSLNILAEYCKEPGLKYQIDQWLNHPDNIPKNSIDILAFQLSVVINRMQGFELRKVFQETAYPAGSVIEFSKTKSEGDLTMQHMGATIIDAVLSAGVSYENTVRPRIEKFRRENPAEKTTSAFLRIISENELERIIDWNGTKIERIKALSNIFKANDIETETDLRIWLSNENNCNELKKIKGIKENTVSYLKILSGEKNVTSIGDYIIDFIKSNSDWKSPNNQKLNRISLELVLERLTEILKVDLASLDYSIWFYMSKINKKKAGNLTKTTDFSTTNSPNSLADICIKTLGLESNIEEEFFYSCLPLCVIDCVFSLGVKYEGVTNVVKRVCDHLNIPRTTPTKNNIDKSLQVSITEFLNSVNDQSIEDLASKIFVNHQRTSSKNGILKAEAVILFMKTLQEFGVEYLQDVKKVFGDDKFENNIKTIKGQSSGISLKYFYMLAGNEDLIKPDRMIMRFLLEKTGSNFSMEGAQELLFQTANEISKKLNRRISAGYLDNKIWQYQRLLKS